MPTFPSAFSSKCGISHYTLTLIFVEGSTLYMFHSLQVACGCDATKLGCSLCKKASGIRMTAGWGTVVPELVQEDRYVIPYLFCWRVKDITRAHFFGVFDCVWNETHHFESLNLASLRNTLTPGASWLNSWYSPQGGAGAVGVAAGGLRLVGPGEVGRLQVDLCVHS